MLSTGLDTVIHIVIHTRYLVHSRLFLDPAMASPRAGAGNLRIRPDGNGWSNASATFDLLAERKSDRFRAILPLKWRFYVSSQGFT